jgi:glycosyltransferase involved in cell wall biosynthesis/SAM-dependent methyltransferase
MTTRKILMLVENLPAPADPRVWIEATTLRNQGYQVSIICPKGSSRHRETHACIDRIHIYRYRLPQIGNTSISYVAEYAGALAMTFWLSFTVLLRHGFDVIHAANPPDLFFLVGLFYRLLGKKFVFDQHDLAPELLQVKFNGRLKLLYRLQRFLEWCSYRTADLVIVTNSSQRRIAIERGHCRANRVLIVRNGPDLERLKPVTPEPGLKKGRRYLLAYVGAMSVQDGVEYALGALHNLVHTRGRQDVSLVLMGNGDHLPKLQALSHELRLDDYVNFTGWVSGRDVARYLTVADVGLSPDPRNPLNDHSTMIKTMEYMAMGKPVVAFDLTETRFSARDAALYATPNLVEDLADKIGVLLSDEELRIKLGAVGRKRIEEELSWDQTKQNLLLAYEMLLPEGRKPSEPGVSAEIHTKTMLRRFRQFAKRSKTAVILYNVLSNWSVKRRFISGDIESTSGSTHTKFLLAESLEYISKVFDDYLIYSGASIQALQDKRVLEIGPGDNFGVAIKFLLAGAKQVVCLDKFFSRQDGKKQSKIYQALREQLDDDEKHIFDEVVRLDEGTVGDSEKLLCMYGTGIEEAGEVVEAESFDLIVSRVVLQDVPEPDLAFSVMDRLLRPGGYLIHKIDFRDHGMFGARHHPLTFLTIPNWIYRLMTYDSGKANRRLIGYYRRKTHELGYDTKLLITHLVGSQREILPHKETITWGVDHSDSTLSLLSEIRPRLQAEFREMPDEDLMVSGVFLVASKPCGNDRARTGQWAAHEQPNVK